MILHRWVSIVNIKWGGIRFIVNNYLMNFYINTTRFYTFINGIFWPFYYSSSNTNNILNPKLFSNTKNLRLILFIKYYLCLLYTSDAADE